LGTLSRVLATLDKVGNQRRGLSGVQDGPLCLVRAASASLVHTRAAGLNGRGVLTRRGGCAILRSLAKYVSMKSFLNMTKALADENRARLLMALRDGELCVCQLTELMGLAMSTVSKHLSILYQAGLVAARKDGRWMYYSLPGKGAPAAAREVVGWVRRSLAKNERIAEDARRLKKVRAMDLAELCKRQCGN
jgi:ArsR family transcriptional regulator, arsenate/arsenite/antimonite-responsive transcriptional repressor